MLWKLLDSKICASKNVGLNDENRDVIHYQKFTKKKKDLSFVNPGKVPVQNAV